MSDIILDSVSKSYEGKTVLNGMSLVFKEGEITCIKGPSGCGKTTLLRILAGLTQKDSGKISGIPERISCVFQENRLCEDFSVLSNIKLVCEKDISGEEIIKNLDSVGLGDNINTPVKELSGGMKRRVALVRAVLSKGELLILDEPFKGLDDDTREDVTKYLLEGQNKRTVIMVTHDPEEVEMLGGRLITL